MKPALLIRKRIKKFKLGKNGSTQQAYEVYHEMYEKIKMKKEELMEVSIRELVADLGGQEVIAEFDAILNEIEENIQFRGK
jgi:pentatricopeptide repeat protein